MSKIGNKLAFAALGAISTMVVQRGLTALWNSLTGEEPPDPNDPEVPTVIALTWAIASGIGLGVVQLLVNRFGVRKLNAVAKKVRIEL
jgi:hypothetical protein